MRMEYRELAVPSDLERYLSCLWHLRADASGAAQTVYPDGRCELIVHLARPMQVQLQGRWRTQAQCLFAAQLRSAIRLRARHAVDCVGLRLQPAASALLVGTALSSLTDQVVSLKPTHSSRAQRLTDACRQYDADQSAEPIWALLRTLALGLNIDAKAESVAAALDQADGQLTLGELARQQAIGLRNLQMRFLRSVGLTVKEYARIRRLQATLRLLDESTHSLTDTALAAGFADQAHATRELQRLTGLTPRRLQRALMAERHGDETLRLAAAFVRGSAGA